MQEEEKGFNGYKAENVTTTITLSLGKTEN